MSALPRHHTRTGRASTAHAHTWSGREPDATRLRTETGAALVLLVVGAGIILLSESMMPEIDGGGEPIDTTIEAILAGEGP